MQRNPGGKVYQTPVRCSCVGRVVGARRNQRASEVYGTNFLRARRDGCTTRTPSLLAVAPVSDQVPPRCPPQLSLPRVVAGVQPIRLLTLLQKQRVMKV